MGLINTEPYQFDISDAVFTDTYINVSSYSVHRDETRYRVNFCYAIYMSYADRLNSKREIQSINSSIDLETYSEPITAIYNELRLRFPNTIDN